MTLLCMPQTEQARALGDSVARFCEGEGGLTWSRQQAELDDDAKCQSWQAWTEQGWASVMVAEEDGGLGLATSDMVVLHQQWGRQVGSNMLLGLGVLGVAAVAACPASALKHRLLPELLAGTLRTTLAWQGSPGAMDASAVAIQAKPAGTGFQLDGLARFVPCPSITDGFLVAAQTSQGLMLCWVPRNAYGLSMVSSTTVDLGDVGCMHLSSVQVEATQVLTAASHGEAMLTRVLALGRLAAAAELLGVAEAGLNMTLQYLRDRQQFGRPIGSNQALQHRAVDLYIQLNLANATLQRAVRMADEGADLLTLTREALASKSCCASMAQSVVQQAIQMHGGIGYTEECELSMFVRRALALVPSLGNARDCRARLARMNLEAADAQP